MIKEAVLQEEWAELNTPPDRISVWVIDMRLSASFVAVLFVLRCEGTPTMEHGLGKKREQMSVSKIALTCLASYPFLSLLTITYILHMAMGKVRRQKKRV